MPTRSPKPRIKRAGQCGGLVIRSIPLHGSSRPFCVGGCTTNASWNQNKKGSKRVAAYYVSIAVWPLGAFCKDCVNQMVEVWEEYCGTPEAREQANKEDPETAPTKALLRGEDKSGAVLDDRTT